MTRAYVFGSLEPCYEHNPTLWNVFCALTNRPLAQPNYNWTEHDVVTFILSRGHINDARINKDDNVEPKFIREGFGNYIRRHNTAGDSVEDGHFSGAADSVLLIHRA